MPYLGAWAVDSFLTFCCNTHNPATGAAADAAAPPTYRIYEDEAGLVTNGAMALYDDANTTGFYSERLQLTAALGFEQGKQYDIYIEATVGGITGTMHHNFQIGTPCTHPGPGAVSWTYTVTDSVTLLPVANAQVWITTDAAGTNTIWAGISDAFGVARDSYGNLPLLDPGTYRIWKHKVGMIDDDLPDTETVP